MRLHFPDPLRKLAGVNAIVVKTFGILCPIGHHWTLLELKAKHLSMSLEHCVLYVLGGFVIGPKNGVYRAQNTATKKYRFVGFSCF